MPVLTSQGTSVSFGSVIGKVVSATGSFATALKEIRPLAATLDSSTGQYLSIYEQTGCDQTLELEVIASSFNVAVVGSKQTLTVTGTGWSLNFGQAICEKVTVAAKVADVLRLNYSFRRTYL